MIIVKCETCFKKIKTYPSQIKNQAHIYCSVKCRFKNHRKIVKCGICGKRMSVIVSNADAKYCSKLCANKAISINSKGNARKPHRVSWGYKYIFLPKHPFCSKQGYVAEHRLVMEKKLGRYLTAEELVHHKNEIRSDNRESNLILCNFSEHAKIHFHKKVR